MGSQLLPQKTALSLPTVRLEGGHKRESGWEAEGPHSHSVEHTQSTHHVQGIVGKVKLAKTHPFTQEAGWERAGRQMRWPTSGVFSFLVGG